MNFVVKKSGAAESDLLEAAIWYDRQQPGLGDLFLDEVDPIIASLASKALHHGVRFADVRCVRLRRFKNYGVFYVIRGQEVRVLAIHHGSRDPRRLRERWRQAG